MLGNKTDTVAVEKHGIKKYIKFSYMLFIAVIVISSLLFAAVYSLDNKFTQNAEQPVNGFLELTEEELEKNPSRYLINDWKLYSGVMLTPEDFADGEPNLNYTVVSIGKDVSFSDGGNCTPFTCGTYVMRLKLPEKFSIYSVEIYQAFSSFRMYIDGYVVLQVGSPDSDNYSPATSNRMATFDHEGADEVLIIINVNNEGFYCGGLIYPPMFGFPTAQNVKRVAVLSIKVIFASVTLISAIMCVVFAIKQRKSTFLMIALIFTALIVYTSYSIVHTFFVMPPQPYQSIELLCGYIVLTGVIMMHGVVCKLPKRLRFIVDAVSIAVLPLIGIYGLNMSSLATSPLQYTSTFLSVYKIAIGAYILITGALALKNISRNRLLIYLAGIVYGCACIWDRLLPLFQPIYVGQFLEWSSMFAVAAIDITFIRQLFNSYADSLIYMEGQRQMSRQLEMQRDYSADIRRHSEENRRLIHDFRQHIRVIDGMAQKLNNAEISDYLKNAESELNLTPRIDNTDFCENSAVDALLRYYSGALLHKEIEFCCTAIVPRSMSIPDTEICSVIGNLLENAMEACERQCEGTRKISFSSNDCDGNLNIVIKNSFGTPLYRAGNSFISSKRGRTGSGIGLMSVKRIVAGKGGSVSITTENGVFMVSLSIPFTIGDNK